MIATIIQRAVMQGTPLLLGSTGEILTEKSGHLNLGIPGIMYVGAISGVAGSFLYEQSLASPEMMNPYLAVIIPLLCALIGSAFMGLIYCFLTVTLRANQNVTGLALTTFGIGIGNFFGGSLMKLVDSDVPSIALSATSTVFKTQLPGADKLGWFGEIFLSYGFMTYLAIVIAIVVAFVITKTRTGLNLRAVGENPATADAAGINVDRYKYIATCLGGMISGLGGLCYVMDFAAANWQNNILDQFGWLSVALVIFAVWRPNIAIVGSIIFGALYVIGPFLLGLSNKDQELIKILPYLVTIIVLVIISIRDKKENQPPASLGVSYFREER